MGGTQSMPAVDSIPLVPMQLGGVHPQHASAEAVTYRCAKDGLLLITCDDTAVAKIRPPAAGVDGSYLDVAPGVEASVLLLVQFAAVDCESSCIASTDAVASITT
ncbi:hypothetical protein SDRG_03682 [Saprolegnia diclina VS20]|uniref:Uncharacterized protein n=1 Tax=Saprolegnia diclina (strain VS20) TaxID=1156394 RepID=T0S7K6_SAPDV|nr:hypothetical protein SDRG_03682 [Saprolegnia diclina VS20]EQC38717.1 hypothetical protein SDRG_03682 [Saprolegnia diclina VS20]|eukprot:XP_008607541.1 hypothetical protein SDRG_03682 [Saprolegnia diclina VS20]